ncbi:hypothetical protein IMCC3135_17910 [Granulosicoccus antarcticus IMCC3135]|uniref:Uncharacterized protein n=2 Tax=Granulosicoccus TaxID=437504 RepID=A0A2Z2NUE8_9GAMM|nr:hypothetical protein IMCC3135_17910 [Granulosicoccus antarcticus IMCC3135]
MLTVALAVSLPATAACAHSFSLAVVADGEQAAMQLNSAVNGILLASQERDGHADETSDGHLGGLDVFIVPLPTRAAETIQGLKRAPQSSIDIAILMSTEAGADQLDLHTVTIRPGTINANPTETSKLFATRFQSAFGMMPDQSAIEGYNAARRIDLAVRTLGGVDDRRALIAALAATNKGSE